MNATAHSLEKIEFRWSVIPISDPLLRESFPVSVSPHRNVEHVYN